MLQVPGTEKNRQRSIQGRVSAVFPNLSLIYLTFLETWTGMIYMEAVVCVLRSRRGKRSRKCNMCLSATFDLIKMRGHCRDGRSRQGRGRDGNVCFAAGSLKCCERLFWFLCFWSAELLSVDATLWFPLGECCHGTASFPSQHL